MDDLRWVNRRTHPPMGGRRTSVGRNTSKNSIIPISAREASLRRKVRRHLRSLGFHKSDDGALEIDATDKDLIRRLHAPQRDDRLSSNARFLSQRAPKLLQYFASGREVTPSAIRPKLERVMLARGRQTCFGWPP